MMQTKNTHVARIFLFCLGEMLSLTTWGRDGIPQFIAEGTISTKSFRSPFATNYMGRVDGKVLFCYSNRIWHVQFIPQYTYPIPIKKGDEAVEDWKPIPNGTRQVVIFNNRTNIMASNGVPVRPFAEAITNTFPTASKKGLFLPWLSLCPNPDLPVIDSNSIPFNFQPRFSAHPQNKGTFRAIYLEPQNEFLGQLDITNNGIAFDIGGSAFEYQTPYNKGFREHSYRVLETTNYQGITFPIHTVLYGFSPLPNGKSSDEIYPSTVTEFYIQKYDFTCSNLALVPVPNFLVALDYRLTTSDAHANYDVINDQWASVTNGRLQQLTKAIEKAAARRDISAKDNRIWKRLVIITLFLVAVVAPIVFVFRSATKKQNNKK
jgi:hypothetical protein